MRSPYWGSEEFEDLVARGLIMCFEDKVTHIKGKKNLDKLTKPTFNDIQTMRHVGPYFPPEDRPFSTGRYIHKTMGLPKYASASFTAGERLNGFSSYLETYVLSRLGRKPKRSRLPYDKYIGFYKLSGFYGEKDGVRVLVTPIGVTESGDLKTDLRLGRPNELSLPVYTAACVFGIREDSKNLWNVQAFEDKAKATFGVYPEQIKSLLYARDLPLTATGRKRPILHWVRSHRRRMQNGTEVDIDKHLRGISEFEMNGTQFRITRPVKQTT